MPKPAATNDQNQLCTAGEIGFRAVVKPPNRPKAVKPAIPILREMCSEAFPRAAAANKATMVIPGNSDAFPEDPRFSMLSSAAQPG